jgi:hypothetical protein
MKEIQMFAYFFDKAALIVLFFLMFLIFFKQTKRHVQIADLYTSRSSGILRKKKKENYLYRIVKFMSNSKAVQKQQI